MCNRTRSNRPNGCPECANHRPLSKTNNFLAWCEKNGELGKKLSREYVDKDKPPTELTFASHYKAKWKCLTCKHVWRAGVSSRTNNVKPTGCPKCNLVGGSQSEKRARRLNATRRAGERRRGGTPAATLRQTTLARLLRFYSSKVTSHSSSSPPRSYITRCWTSNGSILRALNADAVVLLSDTASDTLSDTASDVILEASGTSAAAANDAASGASPRCDRNRSCQKVSHKRIRNRHR